MPDFSKKLNAIQLQNRSDVGLLIAPQIDKLPLPIQRYDDPFLPFGKSVINATRDLVCAYVFDLASYLKLGAAGAIALERTIDYVGSEIITILHGAFALATFAELADENAFGVDALTLADSRYLDAFTRREDRGVFILNARTPTTVDAPDRRGIYWVEDNLFTTLGNEGSILQIRLGDENVLYSGRGEDFDQMIRREIERMRTET